MNKMRILIDIGHPGHVHLLKNCYFELIKNNHTVLVTVKDLPSAKKLLDLYKINYIDLIYFTCYYSFTDKQRGKI